MKTFNELETFKEYVKNIDNEYFQLSRGLFKGQVYYKKLKNSTIQSTRYNVNTIQKGVNSDDFYIFAINLNIVPVVFNGKNILNNNLVVFKPNQEYMVLNKNNNYQDFFIQIRKEIVEDEFPRLETSVFLITSEYIIKRLQFFAYKIENLTIDDEEEILILLRKIITFNSNLYFQTKMNYKAEKIVDFMTQNIHRNLSMLEIADNFKITDRTLRNIFADQFSISPYKFINLLKLNKFKKELINNEKNIIKLIEDHNLGSQSYIIKEFKKLFIYSPSKYRIYVKSKIILD